MRIRSATVDDAERLLEIYAYYVEQTAISFEYVSPTVEEFRERIVTITKKYPYLVLEDAGVIRGDSYAGVFKGRAAYDHCCETTIYLNRESKGNGYGRALYEALESALKEILFKLRDVKGSPAVRVVLEAHANGAKSVPRIDKSCCSVRLSIFCSKVV